MVVFGDAYPGTTVLWLLKGLAILVAGAFAASFVALMVFVLVATLVRRLLRSSSRDREPESW
jgi:membrane protein implicated in regulation of membrane protease activity